MTRNQWVKSTLKNYQAKHNPSQMEVDHVLDFLKAHPKEKLQRASYPQILTKSLKWTKKLNNKNKNIKDCGRYNVVKRFNNGFKFVKLLNQKARDWEGLKMGHCVSDYGDEDEIYSLRDEDNIPHVTFEVCKKKVTQMVGHGNSKVPFKYLSMAIDSIKSNKLMLSDYIAKDYFITLPKSHLAFFKKHFKMPKPLIISKQKYYQVGTSIDLVKSFKSKDASKLRYFLHRQFISSAAIEQFINNKVVIVGSYLREQLIGSFDEKTIIYLLKKNNYEDESLWFQLKYAPVSSKNIGLLKKHFRNPNVIELKNVCFLKKEPLHLIKPFFKPEDELFNFILNYNLCGDVIIDAVKKGIFGKGNEISSQNRKIRYLLTDTGFVEVSVEEAKILKNHFSNVDHLSVQGKDYVMFSSKLKMETEFICNYTRDFSLFEYLIKHNCLDGAICFLKQAKELSIDEKRQLIFQQLDNQSSHRIQYIKTILSVPSSCKVETLFLGKVLRNRFSRGNDYTDCEMLEEILLKACTHRELRLIAFILSFHTPSSELLQQIKPSCFWRLWQDESAINNLSDADRVLIVDFFKRINQNILAKEAI